MKVSGSKSRGVSRPQTSKTTGSPKKNETSTPSIDTTLSPMGADAVQLSDAQTTIETIRELVSREGDIRPSEVERISKKLKSGNYKIDYEKVAEGFIRDVIINEISRKNRKV